MIKFNCLVHKQTGTIIQYEEWFKSYKQNGEAAFYEEKIELYPNDEENEDYKYTSPCKFIMQTKEMLFSDDFEIIYDSEFTLEELGVIFRGNQKFNDELMGKIKKNIIDKELLKLEHGVKEEL